MNSNYILREISLAVFIVKQKNLCQYAENQIAIDPETEKCEQACSWFTCLCNIRATELPLSSIVDEINNIFVDDTKKIVVK